MATPEDHVASSTLLVQILKGTTTQHQNGTSIGPVGSGSVADEGGVATISTQDGIARPASANACSQFLTDWKQIHENRMRRV